MKARARSSGRGCRVPELLVAIHTSRQSCYGRVPPWESVMAPGLVLNGAGFPGCLPNWPEYSRLPLLLIWGKADPYLHVTVAEHLRSQAKNAAIHALEAATGRRSTRPPTLLASCLRANGREGVGLPPKQRPRTEHSRARRSAKKRGSNDEIEGANTLFLDDHLPPRAVGSGRHVPTVVCKKALRGKRSEGKGLPSALPAQSLSEVRH